MKFQTLKLTDKQKQKIKENFTKINYDTLNAQQKQYYNALKGGYSQLKTSVYSNEAVIKLAKSFSFYKKGKTAQQIVKENPVFGAMLKRIDSIDGETSTAIATILTRFEKGGVKKLTVTDGIRTYKGKRAAKLIEAVQKYYIEGENDVFSVVLNNVVYGTLKPFITINVKVYQMSAWVRMLKGDIIEPDAPEDLIDDMDLAVDNGRVELIKSDPKKRAEREAESAKMDELDKERELLKLPKLKRN